MTFYPSQAIVFFLMTLQEEISMKVLRNARFDRLRIHLDVSVSSRSASNREFHELSESLTRFLDQIEISREK